MDNRAVTVETRASPRGEIHLQQRGNDFEIVSNGTFLMATYNGDSERLLVHAALAETPRPKRVLIGGLGVGYSLAAALEDIRVEEVYVVEIESCLIEWNRTHLARFSNRATEDVRTRVIHDDLVDWLESTQETFDAICLDIDNGPDWTVSQENDRLYSPSGIAMIQACLRPEGVVTYWSATASEPFVAQLRQAYGNVKVLPVERDRGEPDYVYLASTAR